MRGSDPNAAVYWLARMIEGGEDVTFIARRMVIFASEDIGNANPNALYWRPILSGRSPDRVPGKPDHLIAMRHLPCHFC